MARLQYITGVFLLTIFLCELSQSFTPKPTSSTPGYGVPTEWDKKQIPNPRSDVEKCGRKGQRSWVCDPNNILTYEEANELDREIDRLRTMFGCRCEKEEVLKCPKDPSYGGWQAGIAIIRKLHMPMSNPTIADKEDEADDVADYLREKSWNLGACDDDMIIVLSVDDRIIYTKTGDKMSGTLTDQCVDRIYEDNKHYLRDAKWAKGLQSMIHNYTAALAKKHPCNPEYSGSSKMITYIVVGVMAGVGLIGFVLFTIKKRGCNGQDTSHNDYHNPSNHGHHDTHFHSSHKSLDSISVKSDSSGGGGGGF